MAESASNIVIGANGNIFTAPYASNTVWPTTPTAALPGAFGEVGFVGDEGAQFTDAQSVEDIPVWQSFYPVRRFVTDKTTTIEFLCKQFDEDTVGLALGGGEVSVASGVALYKPPAPEDIDYRSLVIDWADGDDNYRLVFPRGIVTGDVSFSLNRAGSADLPVSYTATPVGSPGAAKESNAFYLLTDSATFGA